ncbi:MAG: response regulator [Bacteroidota bacterium]
MTHYRTLIVEDEVLIADTLKRYLQKQGHEVVGTAISYEEATEIYQKEKPDLTLLDIRLNGQKTGIDVAQFIQNQSYSCPYIYLSSQLDSHSINCAKSTFPSGYLTKPIQKASLHTTIEMAMYAHQYRRGEVGTTTIQIFDGSRNHQIATEDITYLEVDHVYVQINLKNGKQLLQRSSLGEILDQLPNQQFVQTHRAFAINKKEVNHWDSSHLYVQNISIPVSRARRKEVANFLKNG